MAYVCPLALNNPYPANPLTVTGIGGTAPAMSGIWQLLDWKDITPICPSQSTQCNSSGAAINGVAEATYYTDYNLCNSGCSSVLIEWSNCCRNYSITSGASGSGLYNDITIDLSNNVGNSSPYFYDTPPTYIGAGQLAILPQRAFDADGDSLVYSLAPCWVNPSQIVTYAAGYSPTAPLGPSWGVTINDSTGELSFTPQAPGNGTLFFAGSWLWL